MAVFQKIKQDAWAYNFSDAIPSVLGTGQPTAGSATEVLREEHPSGISFDIMDGTLEGDSGTVSDIPVPSHTLADRETEDSDVVFVATTPATEHQALMEIPIPQQARDAKHAKTAPMNVFKVTPTKQDEAVSTIQSMVNLEDQGKDPNTVAKPVRTVPAPASTAATTSRDVLAMKLKLSAKELKCFQEMVAKDVRMEHLLQTAAQEGTDMPASPSLPPSQEPFSEVAAAKPEFHIEDLVLLAGNTTIDSGDKEDRKITKQRVPQV